MANVLTMVIKITYLEFLAKPQNDLRRHQALDWESKKERCNWELLKSNQEHMYNGQEKYSFKVN